MSFKDFVNEQNSEEILRQENKRNDTITLFQNRIDQLYSDIETDWMREYVTGGQVKFSKAKISITEEKLGQYLVDELHIKIGSNEVVLRPKGTNMIGTDARIDIVYLNVPRMQIVRAHEKIDSPMQMIQVSINGDLNPQNTNRGAMVWKVVKTDVRRTLVKLTKQTFEEAIMEVIENG
jgi:hypothetical protein